jgi:chromosome segregation ATPase
MTVECTPHSAGEAAKVVELESALGSSRTRATSLEAKIADAESRLKGKEAEVSRLLADTATAADARRALETDKSKLEAELDARQTEIDQLQDLIERESTVRVTLQSELDELRTTMGCEQAKRSQAAQSMEHEIASLRAEVATLEADRAAESERAAKTLAQVTAEHAALQTEHGALTDKHKQTTVDLASAQRARAEVDRSLLESATALRTSTSDLQAVRTQLSSTAASLGEVEKLKEVRLACTARRGA